MDALTARTKCVTSTCEYWQLCSRAHRGEQGVVVRDYRGGRTCREYQVDTEAWRKAIGHTHTGRLAGV